MSLGIRTKLLAAFFAVALFTGGLGWYTVHTIVQLNDVQRTVYEDVFGGTNLLTTWVDSSWQARSDLLNYLLTDDPAEGSRLRAELGALDLRLRDLERQMDEADTDREDVNTLARLVATWDEYAAWRDNTVLGALDRGDRATALAEYRITGERMGTAVDSTIDEFLVRKQMVGAELAATAESSYLHTRDVAIALSAMAVGVGLIVGFFLSRSIARAVGQLASAAKGLAMGDLDQEIAHRSRDEFGQLAEAFREMIRYQQAMARAADAIARGDLTQDARHAAPTDKLGVAFDRMINNLRTLVGQLEEREARVRAIMDSVADAIVTFDQQGTIEAFNPTAERVFGYASDDVIGQPVALLLAEQHGDPPATGVLGEVAGRRRDGTVFPMDLAVSQMRWADRPVSIMSARDISDRRRAEVMFRELLESAPDAIVTATDEGCIALVNTQAERLFGYERRELLGQSIEVLLPENTREAFVQQRARYLAAPSVRPAGVTIELAALRKEGTSFPAEISWSPLQGDDGILITSVIRDITQRKRADATQRFLAEASSVLAASLDYQTILRSIARLAVPFLADHCTVDVVEDGDELSAPLAVGATEPSGTQLSGSLRELAVAVHRSSQSSMVSAADSSAANGARLASLYELGYSGAMLVPLVARRRLGVMSLLTAGPPYRPHDLRSAEDFAARCALAIESARLYREAQSAIRVRDDFFSTASHELKTPVAALLAFTQLMLKRAERRAVALGPDEVREAFEEVHWQSDRIARLVGHLLDTSRLDAGKLVLDRRPTDIATLVGAAIAEAQAATQHRIRLVRPRTLWATVDPFYFEQVVTNLLDNAIKYSPAGGLIEVDLGLATSDTIRLQVRDHGLGVPREHASHIFDRFYQAHAGQHFAGVVGMGLGLYISRRIMELHGGSIALDSPPDGGASFSVVLPVGEARVAKRRPRRAA